MALCLDRGGQYECSKQKLQNYKRIINQKDKQNGKNDFVLTLHLTN